MPVLSRLSIIPGVRSEVSKDMIVSQLHRMTAVQTRTIHKIFSQMPHPVKMQAQLTRITTQISDISIFQNSWHKWLLKENHIYG